MEMRYLDEKIIYKSNWPKILSAHRRLYHTGGLTPDKSDNRRFEVALYFSGNRVYQDLA